MPSIPLSTITEIIWPSLPTAGGMNIGMRLCRTDPSFPGAGQWDASINPAGGSFYNNKLYLSQTLAPRLVSDYELSQALQATNGKGALDALNIQFVDVEKYAGLINGSGGMVTTAEDFTGQSTFFTEFFNDTTGYNTKKFPVALWIDLFEGNGTYFESSYLFHVDPNYKPQEQLVTFAMDGLFSPYSRPELLHEGTLRTIQGVSAGIMLASAQCQALLNVIVSSNCVQGAGYMGFVIAPNNASAQGGSNNNGLIFSTGSAPGGFEGTFMQATVYEHDYDGKLYNAVAPSDTHSGVSWPNNSLPWNPNNPAWYGPTGTWWISLGTLINLICTGGVFGQLYASDGSVTGGSNVWTIASDQFTSGNVGQKIYFSKPSLGGSDSAYIYSCTSTNTVTLSSTYPALTPYNFGSTDHNLSWYILGPTSAQLLFDETGQMGSSSPLATEGIKRYKQKPDNTNQIYPVDTSGLVLPKDTYISVNAFFGSHPYDGSYWANPVCFNQMSIQDILQGICNFLCCEYNVIVDSSTKQGRLVLDPIGVTSGTLPKAWIPIGKKFQEVEPSTGATAVTTNNVADDVQIMCPLGSNTSNVTNFPVPIRMRTWGSAVAYNGSPEPDPLFLYNFNYGYGFSLQNIGGLVYDAGDTIAGQSDDCFKTVWYSGTPGSSSNAQLNANVWKGLCFAMFADTSGTNIMYPTGSGLNTPLQNASFNGGWPGNASLATAFYALGCQYGPGFSPVANEPNYQRFNSIDYQAVIFATYLIQTLSILLQRDFFGTTDDGTNSAPGSLSALDVGMTVTFTYDGKERTFSVVELPRFLLLDLTAGLKLQEIPGGGFPDITSLVYGPLPGNSGSGGTSGSGPATGGGSIGPYNTAGTTIYGTATISANTDNFAPPICDVLRLTVTSGGWQLYGMVAGTVDGQKLVIENVSVNPVTVMNNASGTPANKFLTPLTPNGEGGNYPIVGYSTMTFRYNLALTAWLIESTTKMS